MIGNLVDLEKGSISFTLNGEDVGACFENCILIGHIEIDEASPSSRSLNNL